MLRNYYILRTFDCGTISFPLSFSLGSVFIRIQYDFLSRIEGAVPAVNFHDNFRAGAIPLVCITEPKVRATNIRGAERDMCRGEGEGLSRSACDLRACRAYVSILPDYKAISHTILGARCRDIPSQFPFKYRADVLRVRSQAAGVNSRRRFRARDLCHYLRERAR